MPEQTSYQWEAMSWLAGHLAATQGKPELPEARRMARVLGRDTSCPNCGYLLSRASQWPVDLPDDLLKQTGSWSRDVHNRERVGFSLALLLNGSGVPETMLADLLGVSRVTLRTRFGKPPGHPDNELIRQTAEVLGGMLFGN